MAEGSGSTAPPPAGKRMARELYFPTPIYHTDLAGAHGINERVKALIYDWRERDPQGEHRTNDPRLGGWHSPTDMHTRRAFDCLTSEIFEFVHGVFASLGYDPSYEPACDSMWANVNPRYASNRHHTHPHALWSGVYYVQAPASCGLLYFADPRPQTQVMPPYYDLEKRSPLTWGEVHYPPVEGRIIVFPAWLPHAVQPNLTDATGPAGDRISVSFNFLQQRREGAPPASGRRTVRADLTG